MWSDSRRQSEYWNQIAHKMANGQIFNELLAEQYRQVHLNLLNRWADVSTSHRILKTDLFAEALCPSRSFMWYMVKVSPNLIGIDISKDITSRAKENVGRYASGSGEYLCCDVRQLPFASNCFDLIISDSSLDHFRHREDITVALAELSRVLKHGGILIITMDNKGNLTEPLFRLWLFLGLSPYFIGKSYSRNELKQSLEMQGLLVKDATGIIHSPRFFTKAIVNCLRRLGGTKFDDRIRKFLTSLDRLEHTKAKYLTAQFIAVKALKPVLTV